MTAPSPIVVFDFDLTLTRWDTADRFFRWLLRRDRWRQALVVLLLPLLAPLFLPKRTRKWPIHVAVWLATLGRSAHGLERLVREHVDAVIAGAEPVFLDAGLAQLRQHQAQGQRVVIATDCVDALAREHLRRADLGEVALVASTLRPFLGGWVSARHCFGVNKVPMLSERGFAPPWAIVYTDHHCDLPILERGENVFLVNPKPASLARIEQALVTKFTVLNW